MAVEKSCGAFVLHNFKGEIKVLLIKFPCGDIAAWGFPKGHMEAGETEVQTAIREIKEETALNINVDSSFKISTVFIMVDGRTIKATYFKAEAESTEAVPQKEEVLECAWHSFSEAKKLLTFNCDRDILEKFSDFFKKETPKKEPKLVILMVATNTYELEVTKNILKDNKIPFILRERGISGYLMIETGALFGEIEILVEKSKFNEAKNLMGGIFPQVL